MKTPKLHKRRPTDTVNGGKTPVKKPLLPTHALQQQHHFFLRSFLLVSDTKLPFESLLNERFFAIV